MLLNKKKYLILFSIISFLTYILYVNYFTFFQYNFYQAYFDLELKHSKKSSKNINHLVVPKMSNKCADEQKCVEKFFFVRTQTTDADIMFENLRKQIYDKELPEKFCHEAMHGIARAEYLKENNSEKILKNVELELQKFDILCRYGFSHGLNIAMLGNQYSEIEFDEKIQKICKNINNPDVNYGNCVHGLGHVIYDFESTNIENSLRKCGHYFLDNFSQFRCGDGVYMQYYLDNPESFKEPPEIEKFCENKNLNFSESCVYHLSKNIFKTYEENIYQKCNQFTETRHTISCLKRLLIILAAGKFYDPSLICQKMPSLNSKVNCFATLAYGIGIEYDDKKGYKFFEITENVCRHGGIFIYFSCREIAQNTKGMTQSFYEPIN